MTLLKFHLSFASGRARACKVLLSRTLAAIALFTAVPAFGILAFVSVSDARPSATGSTKVAFLQQFPPNQSSQILGNTLATNLLSYRESCRTPQTVSQITPLCVSLGVLTGENPDGSTELSDLTDESPVSASALNPADLTSAPKPVPLGLIEPEQSDKVQLFPRS